MKVREFGESPFLVKDSQYNLPGNPFNIGEFSLAGLSRTRKYLGRFSVGVDTYDFWISNDHELAMITTPDENNKIVNVDKRDVTQYDDKSKHHMITMLRFKSYNPGIPLPPDRILFVSGVETKAKERGAGLTTALYAVLAHSGFYVVSDEIQFVAGQALWKKLANKSLLIGLKVQVWDQTDVKWITDVNGKNVQYDATNLPDDQIWKDISQYGQQHLTTLLVLSK